MKERARTLRQNATEPEQRLWQSLRNRQLGGLKFRRQSPWGPYIADFLCLEAALIVEVDGDTHALTQTQDEVRNAYLESQGFRVIRFSNHDVMTNIEGVAARILAVAQAPHPPIASQWVPPSSKGEG